MPTDTAPVIPARDIVLADPDTGDELMTVVATVVSIERREEPSVLTCLASAAQKAADPRFDYAIGLEAELQVLFPGNTQPHTYSLSRLVGEECWVQDSHFGPNSFPYFSHGFGARYLELKGMHPALEAVLDEAARLHSPAVETGPDIPLVLPERDVHSP